MDHGTRADARRNRTLVLAAARAAMAEHGTSVSLAEVARRAGVGAGTVYRHFPTKTDLLEAVMQQRVDHLAALAARYRDTADPGAAFFALCTEIVVSAPVNQDVCDFVQSDDGWPRALLRGAGARFHDALGGLLAAAQRQGAVRADVTLADVLDLFGGCVTIQRRARGSGRLLPAAALVLDALRAERAGVTESDPAVAADRDETRDGTAPCPVCAAPVARRGAGRPARYCSPACRQKAHRRRLAATGARG
ncbi:TetR/AcrR family transcriptional regulator [Nocardia thailandica]